MTFFVVYLLKHNMQILVVGSNSDELVAVEEEDAPSLACLVMPVEVDGVGSIAAVVA